MNKILPNLFKFLEYAPVVLAFVLPLLFIPLTTEYFETAKVSFLYLFVSLTFVIWTIKMVSERKVTFVRSALDLPLVLLAVGYTVVTLLSPNKYTAIFGSYLRFQPSLLFVLSLIVLYYTLSANLRNKEIRRLTLTAFVLSVGLACGWALLNFFGAFDILTLPDSLAVLKSRAFNTAGSLTVLSVLAGLVFTLSLGLLAEPRGKANSSNWTNWSNLSNYLLTGSLFTTLAVVVVYSTLPGWVALFVGLGATALFESQILAKQKNVLLPLAVWAGLLFIFLLTPSFAKSLNVARPAEINLSLSDSWIIASQTLTSNPLVGAGFGRFPYLFTIFKPLAFNTTPFWNLRFDRPFNEFLLLLSEAGLVGLGLTIFFLAKVVSAGFNGKGLAGVRATLVALVAVYFVTNNSVLLASTLILLLAIFVANEEEEGSKLSERVVVMVSAIKDRLLSLTGSGRLRESNPSTPGVEESRKTIATQILPYFLLLASVLMAIFILASLSFGYAGEYFNRLSLAAVAKNDGKEAYNSEVQAISFNPNLDVYQRNLAQLSLGIAANISARPNLTDTDKQTINNLIQEAIRRGRVVSEIIEPASVANWEIRAQVYQNLIGVAQGAEQWAVDSYTRAIQLDPTNPNLRILLGSIYFGLKNYDLSANSFAQAANLKPDLANAHYNLAQSLLALNDKANALNQYDIVLNLIGTSSPDYKQALKEREALAKLVADENKKAAEAQAAASNPSTSTGQTVSQPSLTVPPPTTNIKKQNVAPLNLGTPKEASPAAATQ